MSPAWIRFTLPLREIENGRSQSLRRVFEEAKCLVARFAEEAAYGAGFVVVVNDQLPLKVTNRASAVLCSHQIGVLGCGHAVLLPTPAVRFEVASRSAPPGGLHLGGIGLPPLLVTDLGTRFAVGAETVGASAVPVEIGRRLVLFALLTALHVQ